MRVLVVLLISTLGLCFEVHAQEEDWRLYKPSGTEEAQEMVPESETGVQSGPDSLSQETETNVFPSTRLKERKKAAQKGEIRYIQDERISVLDEYLKSNPIKHDGHRIQLVFGSKETVASAKSRFVNLWDVSVYEDYLPPNFRVRVGDYLTRFQAEKALREIKPLFPGAYIVRDKVEVPKEFR
jgi:hypothetical protein